MRIAVIALLLLACAALSWLVLRDDSPGGAQDDSGLRAPDEEPEGARPGAVAVRPTGQPPVEIERIEEIPAALLAHLEAAGDSLIDDPEVMNEIINFDIDPRRPRFLTGEDLLRGLSSLRVIGKPIRFLRSEDLEKVRRHVFPTVVEQRVDAGRLISSLPQLGFRLVAWEGEFYLVPHDGFREESSIVEPPTDR